MLQGVIIDRLLSMVILDIVLANKKQKYYVVYTS